MLSPGPNLTDGFERKRLFTSHTMRPLSRDGSCARSLWGRGVGASGHCGVG